MVKVTYSLDDETVGRLRAIAARTGKAQSQIVREAIAEYARQAGRLTDEERTAMLALFDRVVPSIPARPARAADDEIRAVRAARRVGGRRRGPRRR